jgi:hypothetical protein
LSALLLLVGVLTSGVPAHARKAFRRNHQLMGWMNRQRRVYAVTLRLPMATLGLTSAFDTWSGSNDRTWSQTNPHGCTTSSTQFSAERM